MTENKRRLLRVRKSKDARFKRDGAGKKAKLADSWRRPRGLHNKQRKHKKAKGRHPGPGYGSPLAVRGMHPCGLFEIRVFNVGGLDDADPTIHAIRIAGSVGNKKREQIQIEAEKRGLRILNYKDASFKEYEPTEEAPEEDEETPEEDEETPEEDEETPEEDEETPEEDEETPEEDEETPEEEEEAPEEDEETPEEKEEDEE